MQTNILIHNLCNLFYNTSASSAIKKTSAMHIEMINHNLRKLFLKYICVICD